MTKHGEKLALALEHAKAASKSKSADIIHVPRSIRVSALSWGHDVFVFIHPFPDGNGRIARFLMNAMLASGGYPWTVRVSRRRAYIETLEYVHTHQDIAPFARLVGEEMSAIEDIH